MPKRPVTIGSVTFDSVGEAEDYIRTNVIAAHDGAPRIPAGPMHDFVDDLLNLHEDAIAKIGVGVDYFRVDPASDWKVGIPVTSANRTLVVVRLDGQDEDWSWTSVVSKPSAITQVRSALRNAVYDAIQQQKRDAVAAGPVVCPRTGAVIPSASDMQIRHYLPTFARLTEDFSSSIGGWSAISTMSTGAGAEVSDSTVRAAWISYYVANSAPSFELKY